MKLILFFLFLSLSSLAEITPINSKHQSTTKNTQSGPIPEYCNINGQAPITKITPAHNPDYFFKTSSDGRFIYYISDWQNYRIDTKTGVEETILGNADPVPSVDGKILTYLSRGLMLMITPMDANQKISDYVYTTNDKRTYQTVGVIGNKYRIFSQEMKNQEIVAWTTRDYSLDNGIISPVESQSTVVPKSQNNRLPMMSKTGMYYAAFNPDKNVSEIYSIETGDTIATLPVGGGKADFNANDTKIAFHMTVGADRDEVDQEQNFGTIAKQTNTSRNIFVFDTNTKSLKQVTNFNDGNAYFPVFLANGQIMYLYKDPLGKYQFQLVNEPSESLRSKSAIENCLGSATTNTMIEAMANQWLNTCENWKEKATIDMARLAVLNLPASYCLTLGKAAGHKDAIMAKFCSPKLVVTTPGSRVVTKQKSEAQVILNNKCMICHTDIPVNDPRKLYNWKSKIQSRINSTDPSFKMPRVGSLSPTEKDVLIKYLEQLRK